MNSMDETATFIDEFGQLFSESGLSISMGRVMGLLLVCEPHQQSAVQIQNRLQLSSGSVSIATNFLQRTGLIRRTTQPGSRRHYYEVDQECWERVVQSRLHQITQAIDLADRALALRPGDQRLLGMRHLYAELERTLENIKLS